MDLKHLRYLIAAVEEGSTHAAAEKINVAQPALSRRIRDMEATLGCPLLVRSVRGVTPTRAGLSLYRDALAIVENVHEAGKRAQRLGLEQQREIRFGMVQGARKYPLLRQAIAAYTIDFSEAGIALTRGYSRDMVAALRERRLDVALLYEQRAVVPHLAERLIHKERYVVAVHPGHRLATAGPMALSDLSGEPLVWMLRRDSADHHDPLMQACRQHGLEPMIGQWANSSEEVVDLVTVSTGICVTPASSMLSVRQGELLFRSLPDFGRELDLTLGWLDNVDAPSMRAFLGHLHASIDAHQAEVMEGSASWTHLDGLALYRVVNSDAEAGRPAPALLQNM